MRALMVGLSGLVMACGGASTEPAPSEPAVEPAPAASTSTPAPQAAEPSEAADAKEEPTDWLDVEAMTAAFAGAQVVGGARASAWEVDGSTVRVDDGSGAVERTLEFRSPCTVAVKDEESGSSTIHVYAVGEGVRYLGLGAAGVLVEEHTIVACAGGKSYVIDTLELECETWDERFGRWRRGEPEPTCTFENDTLTIGHYEMSLTAPGVYLTSQLASAQVVPHPDFATAQAAL